MAKNPDKPKNSKNLPKKDPARPTRAKAARPDDTPTPDALANLLNPGIGRGTAGMGSGTGLQHTRVTSPQRGGGANLPSHPPPHPTTLRVAGLSPQGRGKEKKAAYNRRPTIRGTAAGIFPKRTRRGNPRQRSSTRRRNATTRPRRSPDSIRSWRRSWAWAMRPRPHRKKATPSIACPAPTCRRSPAVLAASPANNRSNGCCATAGRNFPPCRGRRIGRRDRRNPKAANAL